MPNIRVHGCQDCTQLLAKLRSRCFRIYANYDASVPHVPNFHISAVMMPRHTIRALVEITESSVKCVIQIFHKYACFHSGPFCNEPTRITCGEYPSIVNTIISFIMESDWTDVCSGPRVHFNLKIFPFDRRITCRI